MYFAAYLSPIFSPFLFQQTEIAKRLNAILAQIMPFLSQEVSVNPAVKHLKNGNNFI